jgi:hypothetical protein
MYLLPRKKRPSSSRILTQLPKLERQFLSQPEKNFQTSTLVVGNRDFFVYLNKEYIIILFFLLSESKVQHDLT